MAIKLNATDVTDLDIRGIRISLVNQDTDTCDIDFPSDYDAALPSFLAFDSIVAVEVDGAVVFRGRAQSPSRGADGMREGITVTLHGAWDELASVSYRGPSIDPISGATFASGIVTIGGALSSAVSSVIAFAVSGGAQVQAGTIDLPAMTIPDTSIQDLNCAAVLRALLRWVPDAITWVDYSFNPPKVHVSKRGASILSTIDGTAHDSLRYRRRDDLVPAGVRITYVRSFSRRRDENTGYGYKSSQLQSHIFVASDTAGIVASRRIVDVTHILPGTKQQLVTALFVNSSWWRASDALSSAGVIGAMLLGAGAGVNWSTVVNQWVPNPTYPHYRGVSASSFISSAGGAPNTSTGILGSWWVLPESAKLAGWDQSVSSRLLSIGGSWGFGTVSLKTDWASTSGGAVAHSFTHRFQVANYAGGNPFNQWASSTEDVTTDTLPTAPSGLAALMLATWSIPLLDGTVVLPQASWTPAARRVTIAGVETPVQRVFIDLFSGSVTLNFGPPSQLRPTDFISLARLT